MVHKLSSQLRQSIILAERPAVFDAHVLAFNIAVLRQTGAERRSQMRRILRRPRAEIPDHRHCRLLRADSERPRHSAANNGNELAPPHDPPQAEDDTLPHRTGRVVRHSEMACWTSDLGHSLV